MKDRDQRQKMYNSPAWKQLRKQVLERQPLCRGCLKLGRLTVATVADHKEPWETAADFFGHGKKMDDHFQGLCKFCHREKLSEDMQKTKEKRLFALNYW